MGTPIQGKIYQMYNKKTGANKEKRFPKTVIEAVLGLSSYLQNQFSSLADIYMPIGGIYQSQTGQEFVYRATPNTIKAKSFTLDRIQGKSLAWNQLVPSPSQTNVYMPGSSYVYDSFGYCPIINGHKYLIKVTSTEPTFGIIGFINKRDYNDNQQFSEKAINGIVTANKSIGENAIWGTSSVNGHCDATIIITDITLLYGSEISGMTDAEILAKFESEYPGYHDYSAGKLISNDAKQLETVGKNVWDEEWELGYISVSTGQNQPLSSTFRSKGYIPIVSGQTYYVLQNYGTMYILCYDVNKNYLGQGTTRYSSGEISALRAGTAYIRFYFEPATGTTTYNHDICINLSDTSFNGQYEPYHKSTLPLNLDDFWVKDGQGNQVHITGGLKSAGSVYDEIVGNKYVKRIGSVDLGRDLDWANYEGNPNIYTSTIAFPRKNYSDGICTKGYAFVLSSFNPANLQDKQGVMNNFSMNWGITIKDTSYATAADFKSAMSGVYLYYELATPIEYDLVEPLIYTMKAGTTEARISPNEDGLSAPFCCDMTYSASDNNDADNAQYAATAGRLLNTHTILGQQFNGTQDIGGAISDVSSIDGAIHFDLTNPNSPLVGISTTTPTVRLDVNGEIKGSRLRSTVENGTAPLTVVSSTLVSNLNVEKVGGKTLAEILASDITGNAKTATNAKSESKDDQEFMFRKTNVDWDAKSGVVKKIVGKSLVWNQMFPGWRSGDSKSVSTNTTKTLDQSNNYGTIGHKYYFGFDYWGSSFSGTANLKLLQTGSSSAVESLSVTSSRKHTSYVYNCNRLDTNNIDVIVSAGTFYIDNTVQFDLTLMFGAGNEPSTVAEFEALYPEAYYPYNSGTLISNDAEAVETTGVNQWDEEVDYGKYWNDNLQEKPAGIAACGSHPIKVFPNTAYYFAHTAPAGTFPEIKFGTADGSFISKITDILSPRIITTPNNCEYIYLNIFGVFTYNHDICINLSNAAINGQYFPYWKRTLQLGITTKKDTDGNIPFEDGMKGVGTVQDWCDKVGGEVVMKSVNLGTSGLTWIADTGAGRVGVFYTQGITDMKAGAATDKANLICSKYINGEVQTVVDAAGHDMTIGAKVAGTNIQLFIQNAALDGYSSSQVNAALNGVELIYELATPVPFTWAEPLPSVYPCDQYGTERIISPESTTPSAPFIADLQYGAKSDDVAKELIDTRATVQPLLDAFEYDSTNEAWRLKGNFYADGFVSAYGTNGSEALEALKAWVTENFEPKQS